MAHANYGNGGTLAMNSNLHAVSIPHSARIDSHNNTQDIPVNITSRTILQMIYSYFLRVRDCKYTEQHIVDVINGVFGVVAQELGVSYDALSSALATTKLSTPYSAFLVSLSTIIIPNGDSTTLQKALDSFSKTSNVCELPTLPTCDLEQFYNCVLIHGEHAGSCNRCEKPCCIECANDNNNNQVCNQVVPCGPITAQYYPQRLNIQEPLLNVNLGGGAGYNRYRVGGKCCFLVSANSRLWFAIIVLSVIAFIAAIFLLWFCNLQPMPLTVPYENHYQQHHQACHSETCSTNGALVPIASGSTFTSFADPSVSQARGRGDAYYGSVRDHGMYGAGVSLHGGASGTVSGETGWFACKWARLSQSLATVWDTAFGDAESVPVAAQVKVGASIGYRNGF